MKAKAILLFACLLCLSHFCFAHIVVDETDSPLSETGFCPELPVGSQDSTALPEKTKTTVVCNSGVSRYNNWYSFEKPEALYARKFLTKSIAPVATAALGIGILGMSDFELQLQESLNWNKDLKVPMYDDQLRYAPIVIGVILPLFGKYPKHKFLHLIPLLSSAYLLADGVVHQLKAYTAIARPNGAREHDAFPSQHSSMAFVAATLLHYEFGDYSPWISIGGYTLAGWVAYARVAQNHHWTSDVLTGAAIGTLSTHIVYLSYNFLSDLFTKNNLTICPYPVEGGGGVYLFYSF